MIQDIDNGIYSSCPTPTSTSTVMTMSIFPEATSTHSLSTPLQSNEMSLETVSYSTDCSVSVDVSYVIVTSTVTERVVPG